MYLNPEEVDINEPPIIVISMKNRDKSKEDEYSDRPDVESEDTTAKNTFAIPSLGIIKK